MLKGTQFEINRHNVLAHEIIGLHAFVSKSTDPGRKGMRGRVVDETKNTITIETAKGEKKVPKSEVWLRLDLGREKVEVDGKKLMARPEDRIKIFWRKYRG